MSLIIGVIGPEQLELFAIEFENCHISLCLHCSIYKYQSISSKVGQNIYESKISSELIKVVVRPEQVELFALELESLL